MVFRWLNSTFDRVAAVTGAVFGVQLPEFTKQYIHQLSGHVSELRFQVGKMEKVASASGKTLEAYINKFLLNPDLDFSHQGELMQEMVNRFHKFADALRTLQESSPWFRPLKLLAVGDWETVKETWQMFQPGLPLTSEGVVYAFVGMIIGVGVYSLVIKVILCKKW